MNAAELSRAKIVVVVELAGRQVAKLRIRFVQNVKFWQANIVEFAERRFKNGSKN
tara:strand:+ start:94 stop:258 length:165 start_codon:yes stop_codon:yes gene_type:complete